MKIRQQLTSTKHTYGRNNKKLYITVHQTGNTSKGANAAAHANLQSRGNVRAAAWHWQVDDKEAVQSFTHDWQLWQSGDGRGNGNLNSIAIEMCVNSDGNYAKALENLITLVQKIRADEGIPASRVVQHNHWSGKNCPAQIRARGEWNKVKGAAPAPKPTPTPKPTPKPSPPKTKVIPTLARGSKGPAVGQLQAGLNRVFPAYSKLAVDNSFGPATDRVVREFQRRAGLAVDGRVGPATQAALRGYGIVLTGTSSKPVAQPKGKSISQMATEVLAGKHGNGHANRRKSLGISDSVYQKVRAEVNRRS